ncbi:hypothetical protein FACS189444_2070 [Spirochaetia bacterium]|nr:hypothetical protein FACS189444_2070 [Spirochaetia bacterium]GHV08164.1 hypothetical protein FACS189485_19350 [Spirochaetia bacterium]
MKKSIFLFSVMVISTILFVACATTTRFNVYDRETGLEIQNYTININGKDLSPGDTISLSNLDWKEWSATVRADGYQLKRVALEKEFKVGAFLVGLFLWWPELFWVYGPEKTQTFELAKLQ